MNNNFIEKMFPAKLSYRNFIFIPLFFAFYIVLHVFEPSVYFLHSFKGRPISFASYEGLDIGKRVNLFYQAIVFAVFLVILFTRTIIMLKDYFLEKELSLINGISLAGFCLLVFQLLGANMSASIHFIFSLLLILSAGFVSHQVKKRDDSDFATIFVWTILISISIYFFQWQLFSFAWGKSALSLPMIIVITGTPIYLLFTNRYDLNYKKLKASQPLLFLPLLSFFAIEIFMIMNQRGIYLHPIISFAAGLLIMLFSSFFLYRKFSVPQPHRPIKEVIFQYMVPVTLAGLACMAFYTPVIQHEIDWFEDANHVLPIHQWTSFGKVPFLDSFSSHALSDFGMGLLYSIFNGIDPMGVFVYNFLIVVLSIIIIYFFIYKITGDGFLAIWVAIAYPYTDLLLPSYFNLVPLVALSFVMLYEKQSIKRYVFFFCSLLFLIIWRIDLGTSALVAGAAGFAILLFLVPTFKFQKNNFLKGLGITLIFAVILLTVAFIHSGSHVFVSLNDALAYMSSFQSYGIKDLALAHDLKYYSLYFIFPAVILLIMIHVVFSISRGLYKKSNAVLFCLAIIFFGFFYFSNLQRGLVRHTLTEQWDAALTSFAFFIISSAIFIRCIDKNPFVRFFYYFIAATLIISNYSFTTPNLKKNNTYGILTGSMKQHASIYFSKEKISRFTEQPDNRPKYYEFSEWMKKNFSKNSTFLDFSNSPMLYYFTGKVVPNYFDQIPHTAHNEYLQHRFLDDLKNYEIPVVVFSNEPKGFWDNLDGIPNTLRHYRIAEYIYRNYKPAFIINNRSIWIKKQLPGNTSDFDIDTISQTPASYSLKWIPYIWGTYDSKINRVINLKQRNILSGQNILKANTESKYDFKPIEIKEDGNYILLRARVKSGNETDLAMNYGDTLGKNGSFNLSLKNDTLFHDYLVRISSQYNWYSKSNSWISLYPANNDVEIRNAEILKGD